jgi:imidazolonepropionase-like amidohydrolase
LGPNFFGIADLVGMLEAGKLAEVIATPGDPPRTSARPSASSSQ